MECVQDSVKVLEDKVAVTNYKIKHLEYKSLDQEARSRGDKTSCFMA